MNKNNITPAITHAIPTCALFALAIATTALFACGKTESAPVPANDGVRSNSDLVAGAAGDLRGIMVTLGDDMGQLQSALWAEDFDLIASGAMKVADHPKVSDSEKTRIATSLGSEFGAFVALDKAVHADAVALSTAAATRDLPRIVTDLGKLQSSCVACHNQFRNRLVAK